MTFEKSQEMLLRSVELQLEPRRLNNTITSLVRPAGSYAAAPLGLALLEPQRRNISAAIIQFIS